MYIHICIYIYIYIYIFTYTYTENEQHQRVCKRMIHMLSHKIKINKVKIHHLYLKYINSNRKWGVFANYILSTYMATRPCLISVSRRRLNVSKSPSRVYPTGSQNPTGAWTPNSSSNARRGESVYKDQSPQAEPVRPSYQGVKIEIFGIRLD